MKLTGHDNHYFLTGTFGLAHAGIRVFLHPQCRAHRKQFRQVSFSQLQFIGSTFRRLQQ
jgi:hypothetical protein